LNFLNFIRGFALFFIAHITTYMKFHYNNEICSNKMRKFNA
jgi:hypothetical protein